MSEAPAGRDEVLFAVDTSRGCTEWLASQKASLAVSTYQAGKVIL